MKTNRTDEIIQNIKDCGQCLIDNAEKIANDYKYMHDITITCYVSKTEKVPYINISTDIIPEQTIEK